MRWWKVTHALPYHGEDIVEIRYVHAETTSEVVDVLKSHMHPDRVLFDLYSICFEIVETAAVEPHLVWTYESSRGDAMRDHLVMTALTWQKVFGVSPSVTSSISEYDAAKLVGCSFEDYCQSVQLNSAVTKGHDFIYNGVRYQVKACRPSGKKGSKITKVPKARNYEWDKLIWIMYDENFCIQEAWIWDVDKYREELGSVERISPEHMRQGNDLLKS